MPPLLIVREAFGSRFGIKNKNVVQNFFVVDKVTGHAMGKER